MGGGQTGVWQKLIKMATTQSKNLQITRQKIPGNIKFGCQQCVIGFTGQMSSVSMKSSVGGIELN
jgi:hypothetical protein